MKRILLTAVTIAAIGSVNAQIVNGDLELWTAGEPDSWLYDYGGATGIAPGTNNFVVAIGEGDPATTTEITGASAAGGSGTSALLTTADAVGATVIGAGFTQLTGMLLGEWPYSGNPLTFDFEYQVQPMPGDTAVIQATLFDAGGSIIATAGGILLDSDATGTWTPISIPFTYSGGGAVAKIEVWAQSSYSEDGTPVTGSTLSVDNFAVSGVNGVEEFELASNVYPNPATTTLNFNLNAEVSEISIIGLDGKVAAKHVVNGTLVSIDVSDLNAGVYVYEVVTSEGTVRNTFVKK